MIIFSIPAFQDNYIWALVDDHQQAIIVDPGDAAPVLAFLHQQQVVLKAILVTHKHQDHTGGISALLKVFPEAVVFSHPAEKVPQTTQYVSEGDTVTINNVVFEIINIPGHTLGHIAFYSKPYLFCGDTLFTNGCGRIFEGTSDQMLSSLKKLMMLPEDTLIYCGHEYTLSNINFALHVESHNEALQKRFEVVKQLRAKNKPTVPSTLQLEKATNPFLRCHQPEVMKAVSEHVGKKLSSEGEVFAELRQWKNVF